MIREQVSRAVGRERTAGSRDARLAQEVALRANAVTPTWVQFGRVDNLTGCFPSWDGHSRDVRFSGAVAPLAANSTFDKRRRVIVPIHHPDAAYSAGVAFEAFSFDEASEENVPIVFITRGHVPRAPIGVIGDRGLEQKFLDGKQKPLPVHPRSDDIINPPAAADLTSGRRGTVLLKFEIPVSIILKDPVIDIRRRVEECTGRRRD